MGQTTGDDATPAALQVVFISVGHGVRETGIPFFGGGSGQDLLLVCTRRQCAEPSIQQNGLGGHERGEPRGESSDHDGTEERDGRTDGVCVYVCVCLEGERVGTMIVCM